jgi:type VI secretion system protein ImpC
MAKRKDEFSFGFTSKKKSSPPPPTDPAPTEETPAEMPAETPSDDPFASTTESDPFAATPDASADPFASTDTASSDPFASTPSDTTTDPFATTESADPFAASTETPSDPFASTETPADPFASTEAADPFAEAPAESPTETPAEAAAAPRVKQPKQFRMLVLADLSGRSNRGISNTGDVGTRKALSVDADSLDRVIGRIKPELHLPVDEKSMVPLTFGKLEDFRPDALLAGIEAFQGMLQLRSDLKDAKKFKATAAKVRKLTGEAAPKKTKAAKSGGGGEGDSDFERLLNQPIASKDASAIDAQAFIANLVAGYSVPEADPDQARMIALVEDALSAGLRAVLRHPAFQGLEATWRGIEFLTSRLNTDDDLKLYVMDISKDELFADLSGAATVEKSGLHQVLVEQTRVPGSLPYSLVLGNYEFEQQPRDIALLAKIASLMHAAEIPFVAAATAKVAGFPSFEAFAKAMISSKWQPPADLPMWEKIRGHKYAAHLALTAPRFLLRLPYGPKTDAIETYAFDEMPAAQGPVQEGYVWGNGAFAVAYGIGQAFLEDGWSFTPATDVPDLACHMTMVDGDKEMTPCAQVWISDRTADVLHQLGLVPLLSVKNAASVKIGGIHSLAKGGKALAAAWATA